MELQVCMRSPLDGDDIGAKCPECPHAIGLHAEDYCPVCAIVAHAEAMTATVEASPAAFTSEVAHTISGALDSLAKQVASVGGALEGILAKEAAGDAPGVRNAEYERYAYGTGIRL